MPSTVNVRDDGSRLTAPSRTTLGPAGAVLRRMTVLTRATSSRGENGLVT